MNSTATIFSRLNGDSTLTALLASYTPATGGASRAAIFSEFAPDDFVMSSAQTKPCLVIAAPLDRQPAATLTEDFEIHERQVRGYAYFNGSTAGLDTVMERVVTLFQNAQASLSVTGGTVIASRVSGPVGSPTDDTALIGRRIGLRLEFQAN